MNTLLRFGSCLLLLAMLAPATFNVAEDNKPNKDEAPEEPAVYQFTDDEISEARQTLEALTPQQRALINHLRYLMRPEYEDTLMTGRVFAPAPLPPYETPAADLQGPDVARLWAVLASGMPVTDSTRGWVQSFLNTPIPEADETLGDLGLHMAVCFVGARNADLGVSELLIRRAQQVTDAAQSVRNATTRNSPLVNGNDIDSRWYGNHLWLGLINSYATELDLRVPSRGWGTSVRNLMHVGDAREGWRGTTGSHANMEEFDSNLVAIAALSLAAAAPESTFNQALETSIERRLQGMPAVLASLEEKYGANTRAGTRAAVIMSFKPGLAPEGREAGAWRKAVSQLAIQFALADAATSGRVYEGNLGAHELGLADGRHFGEVSETVMACIALSGGLMGTEAPLAGMSIAEIGRAMHAWSVVHASGLEEGTYLPVRRVVVTGGHRLPRTGAIENFVLNGINFLVENQQPSGGWGSGRSRAIHGNGEPVDRRDPATTAMVSMALMRAGHTPFVGRHRAAVMTATEYLLEVVEAADLDGAGLTPEDRSTRSQAQRKLGSVVDTALTTQFLARALPHVSRDRKLYNRVEAALDKCIHKIETSQSDEGGWITAGWAPVLQSAMFNQALELAQLAGRKVDYDVLTRSRAYLGIEGASRDGRSADAGRLRSTSAGVALYAGSSAFRATASYAAEVSYAMQEAVNNRVLTGRPRVNEGNLHRIGYTEEAAAVRFAAYSRYRDLIYNLSDDNYLKGFGNNGGEEFFSFMMSSETLVITNDQVWSNWNTRMHNMFRNIQNADGSWSGHHCITCTVMCTAAVVLTLTADREVHTVVQTGPCPRLGTSRHGTSSRDTPTETPRRPVTGQR
jgi:hypothetical protein